MKRIIFQIALYTLCLKAFLGAAEDNGTLYSPVGKRDPFKAPSASVARDVAAIDPMERFSIDTFQLRAVLKKVGKSQAMFEDPEGKTHIVSEGDLMGRERGTVSRILDTEVIVTERTFNYLGVESLTEKILSLSSDDAEPAVNTTGGSPSAGTTGNSFPSDTSSKMP